MVRTQVYLTEQERKALQRLSQETGKSQSELIRAAIDRFAQHHLQTDRKTLLQSARGMWKERKDLSLEALRREWDR